MVRLQTYYLLSPNFKEDAKVEPPDLWVLPSEFREIEKKRLEREKAANELFAKALGFK